MKLPLTIIEYYDVKCFILGMHLFSIMKLCMYTKMIWMQRHLLVKTDQPFNRITRGCIYDFSAISIEIILKLLLVLIVAFGLRLHAMLSSLFCCWSAWPRNCCLQIFIIISLQRLMNRKSGTFTKKWLTSTFKNKVESNWSFKRQMQWYDDFIN